MFIVDLFKSRRRLEAENLFLRHQLSIALRRALRFWIRGSDRAFLDDPALAEPARSGTSRSTGDHASMALCGVHGVQATFRAPSIVATVP
jgi:hypothetical protein